MEDQKVAGSSDKVKIYKNDHIMEVFVVDAREICEHNGWSMFPEGKEVVKKQEKKKATVIIEEGV